MSAAPRVIFAKRRPPKTRNFDRNSLSVAANTFQLMTNLPFEEAGVLTGVRLAVGLTLAAAGVSKVEGWLTITPEDRSVPDPTTNEDSMNSMLWLGFWEMHLSQETPFNLNENINVRRKVSKDDNIQFYLKSQSGFDAEVMMLTWATAD